MMSDVTTTSSTTSVVSTTITKIASTQPQQHDIETFTIVITCNSTTTTTKHITKKPDGKIQVVKFLSSVSETLKPLVVKFKVSIQKLTSTHSEIEISESVISIGDEIHHDDDSDSKTKMTYEVGHVDQSVAEKIIEMIGPSDLIPNDIRKSLMQVIHDRL